MKPERIFFVADDPGPAVNMELYRRPGGIDGGEHGTFCGAPHPDNPDPELEPDNFDFHFCRRLKGHDPAVGHAAFIRSISELETWPNAQTV